MRTRRIFAVAVFLFVGILASAGAAPSTAYEIGHTSIVVPDPDRGNRQVPTEIYYPADSAGEDVPVAVPPGDGFPVVAFGHGYQISWSTYDFLVNGLVPEGFVVALPTTGGELFPDHLEFGLDLAFVSRAVRGESDDPASLFYEALSDAAALGGHSMGGGASFLGASEDTTITAIFNLAAAETNPSAIAAASLITAPALVFSGSVDCVTPPADHQIPMYDALASDCKTRVTLLGASHCQFAEYSFLCSLGEFACSDPTLSRAEQHALTLDLLTPWLSAELAGDDAAWATFQGLLQSLEDITWVQDCPLTAVATGPDRPTAMSSSMEIAAIPNPFHSGTHIRLALPRAERVILDIFSVAGRRVVRLADVELRAGSHAFAWDGRDENGRSLASGLYFCRAAAGGRSVIGRLLLVR